ncbi:hypothetical protein ZIOFF_033880 [Zingiber officinale]|uniref:Uncharacterized protein n=1 Tax=Zingiber officinale TaxID=94328 RepID=A0A8J5LCI2_ZINOF|nr:hypothetical protein ZIOFF_033880 [Zingiber officinale]
MTCGVVGSTSCEQVRGHQWNSEDRDARRGEEGESRAGSEGAQFAMIYRVNGVTNLPRRVTQKDVPVSFWPAQLRRPFPRGSVQSATVQSNRAWVGSVSLRLWPPFLFAGVRRSFSIHRLLSLASSRIAEEEKSFLAEFYFLEEISGSSTQEKKREILMEADDPAASFPLAKWRSDFSRAFQYYLDKSTPHTTERWIGTAGFAVIYCLRVYLVQGFYIVSYGLGIYLLNLLIGFLSPLVDPEIEVSDGLSLPTRGSDEFKPFVRRLPEFKFCLWHLICGCVVCIVQPTASLTLIHGSRDFQSLTLQHKYILSSISVSRYSITKAFCVAFVMTFFSVFDVPVFWPILLCYWVVLFCLTMKRQITHMIKYKYVPFNLGKQRYGGKKNSGNASRSSD